MREPRPFGLLVLALLLAACGGASPATGALPSDVAKLLPSGYQVVAAQQAQTRAAGEPSWVILYTLPNPPSAPSGSPRYNASVSIVDKAPSGWVLAKTMGEVGPVGAKLQIASVDRLATPAVSFGIGANSSGLWLLRADGSSYSVIYDGSGDSVTLQDLNGDGTPEVLRDWSPFCQSHVASPRLTTVYAFKAGRYAEATAEFPATIAKDTAAFDAAILRAGDPNTTPAWKPADKACLHASRAVLAREAGNLPGAQAQTAQAMQLDPSYDLAGLEKRAAA